MGIRDFVLEPVTAVAAAESLGRLDGRFIVGGSEVSDFSKLSSSLLF
jgi:hypothetical protein